MEMVKLSVRAGPTNYNILAIANDITYWKCVHFCSYESHKHIRHLFMFTYGPMVSLLLAVWMLFILFMSTLLRCLPFLSGLVYVLWRSNCFPQLHRLSFTSGLVYVLWRSNCYPQLHRIYWRRYLNYVERNIVIICVDMWSCTEQMICLFDHLIIRVLSVMVLYWRLNSFLIDD